MTLPDPAAFLVSFELFPPRSDEAALALGRTIDRLVAVHPAFLSVTFGAGGASRARSLTVLRYILEHTRVDAMAHLTCVGSTRAEVTGLVNQFLDAGIRSFLALRGDLPQGASALPVSEITSAVELIALIRAAAAARSAAQTDVPPRPVAVAVAAFPNGHPRATTLAEDVATLRAKQDNGATLAITQLFWRAEDYVALVERSRAGGVTIPILPGIMPVTGLGRLARLVELSGVEPPVELVRVLSGPPEECVEAGIEYAAALARGVLAAGAPGLHLYTFNRHEVALATLARVPYAVPSLAPAAMSAIPARRFPPIPADS